MQWGTGIFVVAGPIDVINHRINGLDLTSWSPSHLLLYFGTFIMIIGVIRNWYRTYPSDGRFRWQWTAGLTALFAFLFEDAFFPQLQQEYGILEVASWFRGTPYAEPSLLSFAADPDRPAGGRRRGAPLRHADPGVGIPGLGYRGVRRDPGVRPADGRLPLDRHLRRRRLPGLPAG